MCSQYTRDYSLHLISWRILYTFYNRFRRYIKGCGQTPLWCRVFVSEVYAGSLEFNIAIRQCELEPRGVNLKELFNQNRQLHIPALPMILHLKQQNKSTQGKSLNKNNLCSHLLIHIVCFVSISFFGWNYLPLLLQTNYYTQTDTQILSNPNSTTLTVAHY